MDPLFPLKFLPQWKWLSKQTPPTKLVWLASTSPHKINATKAFFGEHHDVQGWSVHLPAHNENPPQPYGLSSTKECALRRMIGLSQITSLTKPDYLVAIENGLVKVDCSYYDICVTLVYDIAQDCLACHEGNFTVPVPKDHQDLIEGLTWVDGGKRGFTQTFGHALEERLAAKGHTIDPTNWMATHSTMSRVDQIVLSLRTPTNSRTMKDLLPLMISYSEDFPKPGIRFANLMPLFSNRFFSDSWIQCLTNHSSVDMRRVTHVMGPELRGSLMAIQLAYAFKIPFVPLRKAGKLPPPVIAQEFTKEYGKDTLAIPADRLTKCDCVLIVDDVLATGGTLAAAGALVESTGAAVEALVTLVDVEALRDEASSHLAPFKTIVLFT